MQYISNRKKFFLFEMYCMRGDFTMKKTLNEIFSKTVTNLDNSIQEVESSKFLYGELCEMCKFSYLNEATIGVNFYRNYDEDAEVVDYGCDNYKDVYVDGVKCIEFYDHGAEIYLDENAIGSTIYYFHNDLSNEYKRIQEIYDKQISATFSEITDELKDISIPGVDLTDILSTYFNNIGTITARLNTLLNNDNEGEN